MNPTLRTLLYLIATSFVVPVAFAESTPSRGERIYNAIIELDLDAARKLLSEGPSNTSLALERARLALYAGDCDGAKAVLSAPSVKGTDEGANLYDLSVRCAQATAGALVVDDQKSGVWVRLQDSRDSALVPYIVQVAVRAREAMETDLNVKLPRPLRIDLVRDLFSLSALTGLRLSAAETTGTLAVARYGRVTMITPRATQSGYGWEDTLAHEITHLALARATRDRAPLWLQEGIAKREETRWREPRPLDGTPSADRVAYQAMVTGRAVGLDKLGPSIAMLPTPEAASIAYAEVQSFVNYWIEQNGPAALHLLLADLKGMRTAGADAALRSVSGYTLAEWDLKWRDHLRTTKPGAGQGAHDSIAVDPRSLARWTRLADLLHGRGHADAAHATLEPARKKAGALSAVRWRSARSSARAGHLDRAGDELGNVRDLDVLHGAWFALHGRVEQAHGNHKVARRSFALGIALDPLFDEVACEGHAREDEFEPENADARALCEAARAIRRN